jgi:hypothetical protein
LTLQADDKDMIVMYHKFVTEIGETKQIDSKMVCIGEDQMYTAMAKQRATRCKLATLLILNGEINNCVQRPILKKKCIYLFWKEL